MSSFPHKLFIILALSLCTATVTSAGLPPGTGTTGSVHDMNMFAFVLHDDMGRACAFCHVPHHANSEAGTLWSKPLDATASGLKPYTWATPDNMKITQELDPLIGPSRLCMTCHDGVIALDAHGAKMPTDFVISKDLNVTHPIGFSYDDAMAARGNRELVDKNQPFATGLQVSSTPGEYNSVLRQSNRKVIDVLFQGTYVTCVACHDVHNKNNVVPDPGHDYNFLLWAKEEQSLICLSCHIK